MLVQLSGLMKILGHPIIRVFTFFLLVEILITCTNEEVGIGKDTIKLSEKEVQLPVGQSSYLITTEGTFWWVNGLYLDGNQIEYGKVNTTRSEFLIENPEFSIERVNGTEIHIELMANETGTMRELLIYLQAGNFGDRIRVVQSGQ